MTLTPLDLRQVRRSFDRAAASYDAHAVLQQEVASRLLERVDYFKPEAGRILDIGCGTGQASAELARRFPDADVVSLDWAPAMLSQARAKHWQGAHNRVLPLCADMQQLPIAARSVDLVFSNLALQWSNDLAAWLAGVRRVLRPGGLMVLTTFGPDTLHELRSAWAQVDQRPHVNLHLDMHDVGDRLVSAGFQDPVIDAEMLQLQYRKVLDMMRELKAIGAQNSAAERSQGLMGKKNLQKLIDAYPFDEARGHYPASYEVIYAAAFSPPEGQPVRAGQGEVATFSIDAIKRGP